jgi:hypothetical protein
MNFCGNIEFFSGDTRFFDSNSQFFLVAISLSRIELSNPLLGSAFDNFNKVSVKFRFPLSSFRVRRASSKSDLFMNRSAMILRDYSKADQQKV